MNKSWKLKLVKWNPSSPTPPSPSLSPHPLCVERFPDLCSSKIYFAHIQSLGVNTAFKFQVGGGQNIQGEGRDLDYREVKIYIFTPRLFNISAERNINEEASIFLYITGKVSSTKNTINIIGFTVLIFEVSAINDARAQQRTNKSFLERLMVIQALQTALSLH